MDLIRSRMMNAFSAGVAIGVMSLGPLPAMANSAAVDYFRSRADRSAVPSVLSQAERQYYRQVEEALDRKDWAQVRKLLGESREGPLQQHARARYYLAPGSPRIELADLEGWLRLGAAHPDAERIAALAVKRGATVLPALPGEQRLQRLSGIPKRVRPSSINDGTMPAAIADGILGRIKADDPTSAQQLLDGADAGLSPAARAEWRQRIAWSYYIENRDADAYRLAQLAAQGSGSWVGEAWWTAGLAAWRLGDCDGANVAFHQAGTLAGNPELAAAGHYWRARAAIRCRKPEEASAALRYAARNDETFYGMLAAEQLGMRMPAQHAEADFTPADWQKLRGVDNVRLAVGLAEIGQDALADDVLRHQARIGDPALYAPLTRLARDLGLPATQLWMSYNAPLGAHPEPAARYPTPKWTPTGGWQVDPALIYAHALQESQFRTGAVSPAGARGLMQIMPAAAKDHAGDLGVEGRPRDLNHPDVNLAFGQRHLNMLGGASATQGLLPKVMAAYNAGIGPVTRWNDEVRDQGDPLLWMESIPYWETRGYVNVVMRNYWMYERQAGGPSESRMALVQGMWPTFPGLSGAQARRMAANGVLQGGR